MARIRMTVTGAKEIKKSLRKADGRLKNAAGAGLYLFGNNVMADSKREVPVDLGALKGSGYVTLPEIRRNRVIVELGYGGPAEDYAVIQHERTDFNHPEGGRAKYLQDPLTAASGHFVRDVSIFARRAFDRNAGARKFPGTPDRPDNPEAESLARRRSP